MALGTLLSYSLPRLPLGVRRVILDAALGELPVLTYLRLRDRGFRPRGIIDIGADGGAWARMIRMIYTEAPILMIEARRSQAAALTRTCSEIGNANYNIALLGPEQRDAVQFFEMQSGSSMFGERSDVPRTVNLLPMITLDSLNAELDAPVFLKLDVQGAELDILRGASKTLERSEVVQLETQLLHYNEGAPCAAEVIGFMHERGFAVYEIADLIRPQSDLVQVDFIFVRNDSPLRRNHFIYVGSV